ncbi:hypothetical protein DRN93_00265 [archaeon]|nr:MAG: hypothetical protein DRN93_00265 [archaeon]
MKCPKCGSEKLMGVGGGRYICRDCGWLSWIDGTMESLSLDRLKELKKRTEKRIKRLKKQLKVLKRTSRWLDDYIAEREGKDFIVKVVGLSSDERVGRRADKREDKGLGIREVEMREEDRGVGRDDKCVERASERKMYGTKLNFLPWTARREGKYLVVDFNMLKIIVDALDKSVKKYGLEDVEAIISDDSITIIGWCEGDLDER